MWEKVSARLKIDNLREVRGSCIANIVTSIDPPNRKCATIPQATHRINIDSEQILSPVENEIENSL